MPNGVRKAIVVGLIVGGGVSFGCGLYWLRHMFAWESRPLFARGKVTHSDVQHAAIPVPGISITLWDGKDHWLPAGRIPRESFNSLWQLLGVTRADWNSRDQKQTAAGKWCPILPNFPLLSELAEIEVDNIQFSNEQVIQLQKEIWQVQETYEGGRDNSLLLTLSEAADTASSQGLALTLSPFG